MRRLVFESMVFLIYVDGVMRLGGLRVLQQRLKERRIDPGPARDIPSRDQICHAIDLACAFYFKQILCLQRSAATVLLLRKYGHNAEMVIGAQVLPFKSHAWVECDGTVVNDKPYVTQLYTPLERC
jgi:hypothetical protein